MRRGRLGFATAGSLLLLGLMLLGPRPALADACDDCQRDCQKAGQECRNAGPKALCRVAGFNVVCTIFRNGQCRASEMICLKTRCGLIPGCDPGDPGEIAGEPHLFSLDRARYDLQAVGEFVVARSTAADLEIQGRLAPYGARVSVMSVLAIRTDGGVLVFESNRPVVLDGGDVVIPEGGLAVGEKTTLHLVEDGRYLVQSGENGIWVRVRAGWLDAWLDPSPESRGAWSGLLGDFDGDARNDFQTREGEILEYDSMSPELLYGRFAMSWRLSQEESFLPYDEGETTETYTDLDFPPSHFRLSDLDDDAFERARQICLAAGVPRGDALRNCIYDVAVTGENEFAESYRDAPTAESAAALVFSGPFGLRVPSRGAQGGTISVFWSGDSTADGEIALLDLEGSRLETRRLDEGNPIDLPLPAEVGTYTVRLVQGEQEATRRIEVEPVSAEVTAADTVPSGAELEVSWSGPADPGDFISIALPSSPDRRWESYAYLRHGNPLTVTAPDVPGTYELRYVHGRMRTALARRSVEVLAAEATLEAAPEVGSGGELEVRWSGPANSGDFISIALPSSPGRQYESYKFVRRGNPLTVTAPDAPGTYELRYVQGQSRTVLEKRSVKVLPAEATLEAAPEVGSGGELEVRWSGPANSGDFVSIALPSSPGRQYESYAYVRRGNPLTVTAPDAPGGYELRYVQGQSRSVLEKRSVKVLPVEATLEAAPRVGSGGELEVRWTGPDNSGDFISIALPSSPDRYYESYTYTRRGNPLTVTAPEETGIYELRYVQGQSRTVLVRREVRVTP